MLYYVRSWVSVKCGWDITSVDSVNEELMWYHVELCQWSVDVISRWIVSVKCDCDIMLNRECQWIVGVISCWIASVSEVWMWYHWIVSMKCNVISSWIVSMKCTFNITLKFDIEWNVDVMSHRRKLYAEVILMGLIFKSLIISENMNSKYWKWYENVMWISTTITFYVSVRDSL